MLWIFLVLSYFLKLMKMEKKRWLFLFGVRRFFVQPFFPPPPPLPVLPSSSQSLSLIHVDRILSLATNCTRHRAHTFFQVLWFSDTHIYYNIFREILYYSRLPSKRNHESQSERVTLYGQFALFPPGMDGLKLVRRDCCAPDTEVFQRMV